MLWKLLQFAKTVKTFNKYLKFFKKNFRMLQLFMIFFWKTYKKSNFFFPMQMQKTQNFIV